MSIIDQEYEKENFIKILSSITPEEMNEMIKRRGKPIKLIMPIYFEED